MEPSTDGEHLARGDVTFRGVTRQVDGSTVSESSYDYDPVGRVSSISHSASEDGQYKVVSQSLKPGDPLGVVLYAYTRAN